MVVSVVELPIATEVLGGTHLVGGVKLVGAFSVKGRVDMFHISVGFLVALAGDLVDVLFPDRFSIGLFVVIVTCQILSGGIVVVLRTSDGRDGGAVIGNLSFSFSSFSSSLFLFWRFLFGGSGCVQSLALGTWAQGL